MRDALRLQRADRGQRGERRIAIVGAAAAIELAVLVQRIPRSVALSPAGHLRLLVQVAVEQHRAVSGPGDVEIQQRGAARQADDFDRQSPHRLLLHPCMREPDDTLDVAMTFPLRIEVRRLRRNADVIGELRDDVLVPLRADCREQSRVIHYRISDRRNSPPDYWGNWSQTRFSRN